MSLAAMDISQLLALAEPRGPAGLPSPDPGAVLALACHVVMVQSGLQSTLPSGDSPANKYAPRPGWTREFRDEWKFSYTAPGKRNTLYLHCSLQRASGRMLVHTLEASNPANDHLLGLLLPKYIPDEALLSQPTWGGVVRATDALVPMLRQHVIEPLLEGAAEMPPGEGEGGEWLVDQAGGGHAALPKRLRAAWASITGADGSYVVPAVLLTGLALSGVAAYVVMRRRRGGGGGAGRLL